MLEIIVVIELPKTEEKPKNPLVETFTNFNNMAMEMWDKTGNPLYLLLSSTAEDAISRIEFEELPEDEAKTLLDIMNEFLDEA